MCCFNKNDYNMNCCAPLMKYVLITGPTGAPGIAGTIGPTGPTGATGPTGSLGTNAYNLYVQASAPAGGDGSQLNPFQTIEDALAVAKPNGIINVLSGTYPITNQIVLNIPGLTLKGIAGTLILLKAPIIPFLCNGNNITIDSFNMTSDLPYPVEFIQIAGDGNKILNCQIYGPNQPGDSSTWVVNRGIVTQLGSTNLLVQNNILHTLRQPAYFNPNSTGIIMNNVVYNTRGYVVDKAVFLFVFGLIALFFNRHRRFLSQNFPQNHRYMNEKSRFAFMRRLK